jgi:hypothetical protein
MSVKVCTFNIGSENENPMPPLPALPNGYHQNFPGLGIQTSAAQVIPREEMKRARNSLNTAPDQDRFYKLRDAALMVDKMKSSKSKPEESPEKSTSLEFSLIDPFSEAAGLEIDL